MNGTVQSQQQSIGNAVVNTKHPSFSSSTNPVFPYFLLAVSGFSFWFFVGVPFASHRETYWWLAMVQTKPLSQAFGIISSTYRPLAQGVTWSAFLLLDPRTFPTSVARQSLLQGFIYCMFVLAWWLMYSSAPQRRVFAVLACLAGGVFFSGYVHLFHIYGLFYVAVMLTLGSLLRFYGDGTFRKREGWFAVIATLLVFWHPFATALFIAFYFGFCVETFHDRAKTQLIRSVLILLVGLTAIGAMAVLFARSPLPLHTRFAGFLVSYRTNEVSLVASAVAFVFALLAVFSFELAPKLNLVAALLVCGASALLFLNGIPLVLLWIVVVLIKLFLRRRWSLFFLMLAATVLPFGGGIGTPMYGLFAIILATYGTAYGFSRPDETLSRIGDGYIALAVSGVAILILVVRAGINVPVVTRLATPFLAERERTYQLETALNWLHNSKYCGDQLNFTESAGSPVESVESALSRQHRPPASSVDIDLFWTSVLQCRQDPSRTNRPGIAVVTFGGEQMAESEPVFRSSGRYSGDTTVWIRNPQN